MNTILKKTKLLQLTESSQGQKTIRKSLTQGEYFPLRQLLKGIKPITGKSERGLFKRACDEYLPSQIEFGKFQKQHSFLKRSPEETAWR